MAKTEIEEDPNFAARASDRQSVNLSERFQDDESGANGKVPNFQTTANVEEIKTPPSPSGTSSLNAKLLSEDHKKILNENRAAMNMNPRKSLKIYPRLDKGFKAKKSLNFDMMKSNVFIARGDPDQAKLWRWISYFLIGIITGLIAFLMEIIEEYAVELRNYGVENIIEW